MIVINSLLIPLHARQTGAAVGLVLVLKVPPAQGHAAHGAPAGPRPAGPVVAEI